MFGVLFDLYLLSSGHRPGAACHAYGWPEQSLGYLMAQGLLNHLTYFVCCKKKKKVYFAWESHFLYNCTAFKGWEVEKYPKIGCRFLQLCLC